jgi:glycerol-3-phosphate acyltransferase PlsY
LWFGGYHLEAPMFLALTALLWFMHRGNLQRLLAGTEGKIGKRSTTASDK